MNLVIDGQPREFISLKAFRASADLPPEFGIGFFTPKDYTGLGSIDRAGSALQTVRESVLEAMPLNQPVSAWLPIVSMLEGEFRRQLTAANPVIGLREPEIDFAVIGFTEVCQAFVYAQLRATLAKEPAPTFRAVYGEWLNASVFISQPHPFQHAGEPWQIRILRTAYGPCGLIVYTGRGTEYVQDGEQACPAEGFMLSLLRDVTARFAKSSPA